MESKSSNPQTRIAAAQKNSGDMREPGQAGRSSDETGASMRGDTRDVNNLRRSAVDAVNAAGKKIEGMKRPAADLKQRSMQFPANEPMKAVVYAAVGSAVLTAVLLLLLRGRR